MKLKMNYIARTTDFTPDGQLTPYAILDYFQIAASIHAIELGLSFEEMLEDNMLWVVLRIRFDVLKNPKQLSEIKLITWPEPRGKVEVGRSHLITDSNDEVLVKGKASWVVIDSVKRKILRASDIKRYSEEFTDKSLYDENLKKLTHFDYLEKQPVYSYKVYKMDIDRNGHCNNTKYANMVYNAIDLKDRIIKGGQIDFINEARLGDTVDIYIEDYEDFIEAIGVCNDKISFVMKLEF